MHDIFEIICVLNKLENNTTLLTSTFMQWMSCEEQSFSGYLQVVCTLKSRIFCTCIQNKAAVSCSFY